MKNRLFLSTLPLFLLFFSSYLNPERLAKNGEIASGELEISNAALKTTRFSNIESVRIIGNNEHTAYVALVGTSWWPVRFAGQKILNQGGTITFDGITPGTSYQVEVINEYGEVFYSPMSMVLGGTDYPSTYYYNVHTLVEYAHNAFTMGPPVTLMANLNP